MFFIQQSYKVKCGANHVHLMDIFEGGKKQPMVIDITDKVKFIWGKAYDITSVNLYSKDLNHIPKIIREVFRDPKSLDFYRFLINERVDIHIPIKDIKYEFPSLYGDRLQDIISKNITKDNV